MIIISFAIEIEYFDQKSLQMRRNERKQQQKQHSKNGSTSRKSNSHEKENGRSRKIDDKLLMENVHKCVWL